jgi:hypothetical protein
MNGQHARAWYGREFTASPMAEVLRALNAELRAAGAVTVYVVAPTPRADLNELGVSLVELNARKERLRRMIGASRAQWIDTSALYERNDFLDGFHVRPELVGRMTAPVVDRLRPILEAQGVPPVDERAAGVEAVADVVPPNGAVQAEARPGTDAVQTAAGMAP